jgi:TPR repeat protein
MIHTAVCSLAVALVFVSCASSDERPISGVEQYGFEGGLVEQRELERQARAGDSEAAIRVGRYYEMVTHDYTAALQWFNLSAKLGNKRGAYFARSLREALPERRS